MTRSRIAMSREIFDKIFSAALTEDSSFPLDAFSRWIKRKDADDARLMAEASMEFRRLGQREVTAIIAFEGRQVFCMSGYKPPEEVANGLSEIDVTPGLFATFVTGANIPSVATAAQARDLLKSEYRDVEGYDGHDLEAVMKIFPRVYCWEIDVSRAGNFAMDIFRISGSFVVRSYGQYPLEISAATRSKIIRIFEGGPDFLPYPLILQGVLSYSWQSIFLDFYRSIEQLYGVPRLEELSRRLNFGCTLSEVAEALESCLSWRPKEEEALSLLLRATSDPVREALLDAVFDEASTKPEATPEKCASQIYKLRNSHVHFRPALRATHRSPEKWDSLISAMCDALLEVYERFGADFLVRRQARA